ncbi:uncharacterized protein F54H12.2-like [Paramacrobiotus metropolitanus]|uniref:uncharacterized protein F54H12.2-like n=2 Tax=Paramacrobiotus metropolitanus TaxID=2943436 RepID=UPI0024461052|nr:uncharacterized protein F54H12.2-like [Paramacrobiotus metropolitanus]
MAMMMMPNSEPAMQLENQLFALPATLTDRWRTEHEKLNPTTIFTEDGTAGDINFYIPPSTAGLLSLGDMVLELEVAIKVKKNNQNNFEIITAAEGVAPVNNFLHSIFQSVHVTVANRLISDAATFYPYRAYFESLLFHSPEAQFSQLSSAGYALDLPGKMNNQTDNTGEVWRHDLFGKGEYVQLSGKIFADLFDQSKPLCTGIPVQIRLVMNRPEFCLRVWDADKDTKTYKPFIRNARLSVRRYIPAPDFMTAVAGQLLNRTVKYHIERIVMRVADIPKNTQSTVVTNLQIGQIPKVVFIGFLDSEDFHGNYQKNPFNFHHFDVRQISVEVDGQSYPTKPYNADFAKNQSLECYDGLLDALGAKNHPTGCWSVNRNGYNEGYAIFGFDLTPGHTGRGPLTLIKQGNLSVSVTFAKSHAKSLMMVCMMVFDSIIEFNQHRQLIADFST